MSSTRRVLRETETAPDEPHTFLAATAHRQFLHSLMICDILASFELGVRATACLQFIPWPEILARAPVRTSATPFRILVPSGGHVVPDGLFGIEYATGEKKTYRFFALEADRGTMPIVRSNQGQTSYLRKLAAYGEIIENGIHKSHLGIPNLLVLTVTTNSHRAMEIMRRFESQRCAASAFLFKSMGPSSTTFRAFQDVFDTWQRVGFGPVGIDIQRWDDLLRQSWR